MNSSNPFAMMMNMMGKNGMSNIANSFNMQHT